MNSSPSPSPAPNEHERLRLFAMKADGTITPEDHEKLCQLLADSPQARREWFAFQDGEDALQSWSQRASLIQSSAPAQAQVQAPVVAPVTSVKARTQRGIAWRITAAMAAGIVIGAVAWALWPQSVTDLNTPTTVSVSPSGSNVVIQDEATTSAVAVLTRGVDLVWEDNGTAPSLHEPLSPGELKLRSGVAEIEFFQGARLCIEGPAELKLISAGEAFCKSGRFSADVPFHARGFRIGTPKGDLVDLGTEFGLDLTSETPALHVFKGEVELHRPKNAMQLLTTGQAARMESSDTMNADATGFTFSRDLDSRVQVSQRQAFDAWQQSAAQQRRDPALLLRLDFQDGAGARSLQNTAPQGPDIAAGTIVGCSWTQGRWPGSGKQALQFRSLSDRVRLKIPGQYRQFTAVASVQLNGLNIRQSSICMTQGLGAGYMHWQVLNDGSLCLGVGEGPGRPGHGVPVRWQDYISPVLFTPERFGQWLHLAMVYDLDTREVRFYLNGTRFSTHPIKEAVELSPGLMELGNWTPTPDKRQQPVRNFNGCMDEFSLISRALSDAEIRQLAR